MKRMFIVFMLACSAPSFATGWSSVAVPTQIHVERGGGFMIYGDFGNTGGCVTGNQLYIRLTHPQYKEIYAAALSALIGKFRIQGYVTACETLGWFSGPTNTFNIVDSNSALIILD